MLVSLLIGISLILLDVIFWLNVKPLFARWAKGAKDGSLISFWIWGILGALFIIYFRANYTELSLNVGFRLTFVAFMSIYFAKFFALLVVSCVIFFQKTKQLLGWLFSPCVKKSQLCNAEIEDISRREFIARTALVAASIPVATMSFGIISGAHDYQVRRQKLVLPNLPQCFEGLRIAQISDIHAGSFYNKTAVKGGVEILLAQKPDIVFFTGDLINRQACEMNDYIDVFNKVKAPLGVYAILGNHDYGNYLEWSTWTKAQKEAIIKNICKVHQNLGWDLLLNENVLIKENNEQIAIIGVENWGDKLRFPKFSQLDKAKANTQDAAVKLLLSHDPSHWRSQVVPEHKDIDVMFAGHTHGMQFGIEIGDFQWSPVQYIYPEWAGLYTEGKQAIYVNRGYGYIGFPGRIGIPPEITIFELKRT
ncbi:MAG: metallophosphoesterase [Microscillaceae bacterium]|nr:metallophosphoesterase [Microscillaceae bacterium]MDW8460153.1 metallophosphoesterase [Cytophagales bacterium]